MEIANRSRGTMRRPFPYRPTIESPMKPSARSFTIEIKRNKRPLHTNALSLPSSRPGEHSPQQRVAEDTPAADASRTAAPAATLSEAERVFGRRVAPMSVAAQALEAFDPRTNPELESPARSNTGATLPPPEESGSAKPSEARVLADLLSVAREEERVREAQMLWDSRRLLRSQPTPPRPKTTQPEASQTEEHSRSRPVRQPPVGVENPRKVVPAAAEAAGVVAVQPATGIDEAPRSAKPNGTDPGNGRRLRRWIKRERNPIPLKAGERWKRRLPLVCR
jgi:hypothetical protein